MAIDFNEYSPLESWSCVLGRQSQFVQELHQHCLKVQGLLQDQGLVAVIFLLKCLSFSVFFSFSLSLSLSIYMVYMHVQTYTHMYL